MTFEALACASSLQLENDYFLMRRGEPSVCKQKSTRQTKLCDFNRLRGATGIPEARKEPPQTPIKSFIIL
jgi:hypothetical protein